MARWHTLAASVGLSVVHEVCRFLTRDATKLPMGVDSRRTGLYVQGVYRHTVYTSDSLHIMKTSRPVHDFLPLKQDTFHVLLGMLDGERHGYALMREVSERSNGRI